MIPFRGKGSDKNEIKIREIWGFRSVDVEVQILGLVTSSRRVIDSRCFEGTYRLHPQASSRRKG